MGYNEVNIGRLDEIRTLLSTLRQQIYNNDLTAGQANSTAIVAVMAALDTAIQASTNLTDLP